MADEVIIEEYEAFDKVLSTPTVTTRTTVLDIAAAAHQLNDKTELVIIQSKGTGFWAKVGGSDVSAAADTDGNMWIPADQQRPLLVGKRSGLYIDTAADA